MTVKNGLKKLEKLGKIERESNQAWVTFNGYVVSFRSNGEWKDDTDIVCERARRIEDHDEMQSDYHAGSYFPNLTQAIKYVQRQEAL